jgi:hypothetical protein
MTNNIESIENLEKLNPSTLEKISSYARKLLEEDLGVKTVTDPGLDSSKESRLIFADGEKSEDIAIKAYYNKGNPDDMKVLIVKFRDGVYRISLHNLALSVDGKVVEDDLEREVYLEEIEYLLSKTRTIEYNKAMEDYLKDKEHRRRNRQYQSNI